MNLVLKRTNTNKAHREQFRSHVLFGRELHYNDDLMPKFHKFQLSKGLGVGSTFSNYPKCYEAVQYVVSDDICFIFDDLRAQGFDLFPKRVDSVLLGTVIVTTTT